MDLEIYTDKLAAGGGSLMRKAYEAARERNHNQIAPEHVLISIAELERPFFDGVMLSLNLDSQAEYACRRLKGNWSARLPGSRDEDVRFASDPALQRTQTFARAREHEDGIYGSVCGRLQRRAQFSSQAAEESGSGSRDCDAENSRNSRNS